MVGRVRAASLFESLVDAGIFSQVTHMTKILSRTRTYATRCDTIYDANQPMYNSVSYLIASHSARVYHPSWRLGLLPAAPNTILAQMLILLPTRRVCNDIFHISCR